MVKNLLRYIIILMIAQIITRLYDHKSISVLHMITLCMHASIPMKPYIKGQYWMITTIPLDDNYFMVGASLSKPHSYVEKWCGGPCMKNHDKKRDCNTLLWYWYSGSCTNKHNKLTDTSIQVHCDAKIFGIIY